MAAGQAIKQRFEDVSRIEILNRRENVQFEPAKPGKDGAVAIDDIPVADTLAPIHTFADSTTRPFFAPQAELSSPPNLKRIERRIRVENFRWNGPYHFARPAISC